MNKQTKVILITGFLGSGKTTLLNRIIERAPATLKLAILMNEFGEIGIDGTLVEGDDIDMLEISRGSIFCVCVKTDFIKGLYELNSTIQPDVLIIESTGVANPTDLKRDLRLSIFNNRFDFTEQFCIIDAPNFLEAFEVFASVEKQLETSSVFIINKADQAAPPTLKKIKDLVSAHHPDPVFHETSYCDIPLDSFPYLMIEEDAEQVDRGMSPPPLLSSEELESFIEGVLKEPGPEAIPPDQLASVTYTWNGKTLDKIEEMARLLPREIVRAKGFVEHGGAVYLFSQVMGDWTIEELPSTATGDIGHMNMLVFIGSLEAVDSLDDILGKPDWSAQEVLQPFRQIVQM